MDFSLLSALDGLFWLTAMLVPLVFIQRRLHFEIQAVFLLLTRNPQVTFGLFAILFFPGVTLHEVSHFVMARLLRVRTGGFSLIPEVQQDRLRLGYVETEPSDFVRDSLIGAAPLIAGGLVVAYIAIDHLHMLTLWNFLRGGNLTLFWRGIYILPTYPDFLLWFYLTFAVSSTMLPSQSDRHAWGALGLAIGILFGLALLAGIGPWMLEHLAPPLNNFLRSIATIFALSAVIQGILALIFALVRKIIMRVTGLQLQRAS